MPYACPQCQKVHMLTDRFCSGCGGPLQNQGGVAPNAELSIDIGSVKSTIAHLDFALVVKSSGNGFVKITVHDVLNPRRYPTIVILEESTYQQLKNVVNATDATIDELKSTNRIRALAMTSR